VIDDREVWACANMLLKQHGDHAWTVAIQRAEELLVEGQMEGHQTFVRIACRIKELGAMTPKGEVH
jgi:hypothetical protein